MSEEPRRFVWSVFGWRQRRSPDGENELLAGFDDARTKAGAAFEMTNHSFFHHVRSVVALVLLGAAVQSAVAGSPHVITPAAPQTTFAGTLVVITVEGSWSGFPPGPSDPDPGMDEAYLIDSGDNVVAPGNFESGGFLPNSLVFRKTYSFRLPLDAAVGDKFRGRVDYMKISDPGVLQATSPDFEVIAPVPQRSARKKSAR